MSKVAVQLHGQVKPVTFAGAYWRWSKTEKTLNIWQRAAGTLLGQFRGELVTGVYFMPGAKR